MSMGDVATYLSDHLAGSTAAVSLLRHLKSVNKNPTRARFLVKLLTDIEADQKSLQDIMGRLHTTAPLTKQTVSWLAEKTAQLKLWFEQSPESSLFWFESFEVLALGIEGKLELWRALSSSSIGTEIGPAELTELKRRATSQRGRIEKVRLCEAKATLTRWGSSSAD
jgi:hypothetical protein